MLKQTITFNDFNGREQTRDLYFNLTVFELVDIQANSRHPDGIQAEMMEAVRDKDMRALLDFMKMLIHASYGIKSEDGIHFRKSKEIVDDFVSSAAYSDLLMSLFQEDGKKAEQFINGLMPKELVAAAIAQSNGTNPTQAAGYQPDARERFAAAQAAQRAPEPSIVEAQPVQPFRVPAQDAAPVEVAPQPAPQSADEPIYGRPAFEDNSGGLFPEHPVENPRPFIQKDNEPQPLTRREQAEQVQNTQEDSWHQGRQEEQGRQL